MFKGNHLFFNGDRQKKLKNVEFGLKFLNLDVDIKNKVLAQEKHNLIQAQENDNRDAEIDKAAKTAAIIEGEEVTLREVPLESPALPENIQKKDDEPKSVWMRYST